MGGTLKKMKRSRQIGITHKRGGSNESNGSSDSDFEEDDHGDLWADEINRINRRATAITSGGNNSSSGGGSGGRGRNPNMTDFAKSVLTPRPISCEPTLELDGSTGDDNYYTPQERQRYEQPIPNYDMIALRHSLAPGTSSVRINWRRGEMLGTGAFGNVYLGLNVETGTLMAAKQISLGPGSGINGGHARLPPGSRGSGSKSNSNSTTTTNPAEEAHIAALQMEIQLMKGLNHKNIVRYFGTEVDYHTLTIFMEYVPGGSLAAMLRRFGPFNANLVSMYTTQLLRGLHYLHSYRIVHRDIKGGNILVDNYGICKLADFGASKRLDVITNKVEQS